jgi:hypothetical protein
MMMMMMMMMTEEGGSRGEGDVYGHVYAIVVTDRLIFCIVLDPIQAPCI